MNNFLQVNSASLYMVPGLFIRNQTLAKQIPLDDILFMQAESAYTRIFIRSPKESYLSSQNLGKIEKKLQFPCLCRVHRSFIVNLNQVTAIVDNGLRIEQHYIPVGKNYRHIMNCFIFV